MLRQDVGVSGWGTVELFASSDCDDTEWHVRLVDVQPGRWSQGRLPLPLKRS